MRERVVFLCDNIRALFPSRGWGSTGIHACGKKLTKRRGQGCPRYLSHKKSIIYIRAIHELPAKIIERFMND
ncbi:MAG: hypothetical protein ACK4FY_07610 [Aquificaceae bacterium]